MTEQLLRHAMRNSHYIVECLLRAGADASAREEQGNDESRSVLHIGAGNPRIVCLLLLHQALSPCADAPDDDKSRTDGPILWIRWGAELNSFLSLT